VNTAWALLGLMSAKYPDEKSIRHGIEVGKKKFFFKKKKNSNINFETLISLSCQGRSVQENGNKKQLKEYLIRMSLLVIQIINLFLLFGLWENMLRFIIIQ
jgi:hypothetical protein